MKRGIRGNGTFGIVVACALASITITTRADDDKSPAGNAAVHEHQAHGGQMPMLERLRPLSGKEFEKQYIKEMIQHHKDGVQMAGLAVTKAAKTEVRSLAEKNIEHQTKEIGEMANWLKTWHQDSPMMPGMDDPSMKMMMKQMQELKATSGPQFDLKFLASFSHHHQEAVELGKLAKTKGVRGELEKAVDKMLTDQSKDIKEMERLQAQASSASVK